LSEKEICLEIETQARAFPVLEGVDEIWFAEIAFYDSSSDPSWRDAVGFNRYTDGGDQLAASMEFFQRPDFGLARWRRDHHAREQAGIWWMSVCARSTAV
jgi:hypothetical protein